MKTLLTVLAALVIGFVAASAPAHAQAVERLSAAVLDVTPPSERVRGLPGEMTIRSRDCRSLPGAAPRRRIVDIAVQEWGFFGFPVLDRISSMRLLPPAMAPESRDRSAGGSASRRGSSVSPEEGARVAGSIAGYWSATPDGAWVVADQNRAWNGERGTGARWVAPWSAAFISWVMCEAGLGGSERFQRGVAHWVYIDQAIRARDGRAPDAAFVAHDIGEATVEPGDLLCSSRRPQFRNLAERRAQLGEGARTHCDIVVAVDARTERIFAIGGNVLRSVSLKVLPASRGAGGQVRPRSAPGAPLFAHLELRGDTIEATALLRSPTISPLVCLEESGYLSRPAFLISTIGLGAAASEQCADR